MTDPTGSLPRLAVPYREGGVSPLRVAEGGRGTWHTLWLLDRNAGGSDSAQGFLNRIGTVVDITGLPAADAAAKLAVYEPSGITAFADDDIMRMAQIAEVLALPYQSVESADRLTNKVAQRQALRAAGLPVPQAWPVSSRLAPREFEARFRDVRYPVIVKPQAGASSRDTVRASDAESLRAALNAVDVPWIVEELIPDGWPRAERPVGDYVSVESVLSRGRTSHAAVTGKTPLVDPFRETGSFIPADISTEMLSQVLDVASAAIAAMDASVGAFHTEIKLTPEGPRVIEVNGRFGGSVLPDVFMLACGQSAHRLVGTVALGADVHFAAPLPCSRVAYVWWLQAPVSARRLVRLDNLDLVRQLPGVEDVIFGAHVGAELDWRVGTNGALFTVMGTTPDHAAMVETICAVEATVRVEYESA